MKKFLLAIGLIALSCLSLKAQNVNVSATAGISSGSYASLNEAFAALNDGTHQGSITITIVGNSTEAGQAILKDGSTLPAGFTSVRIVPSGHRLVQGNIGSVLVDLQGADNVTIDGLADGDNSLTLENQTTVNGTGIGTVRFLGGANNNTITRCTVLGCAPGGGSTNATIICGDGSNNNNTVSYCKVGPSGSNLPAQGILSYTISTNSNFQVLNNEIYDFLSPSSTFGVGINLSTGTATPTASGNRLYQTAGRVLAGPVIFIQFNNTNSYATISNNVLGFANAAGTGSAEFSSSNPGALFRGIYVLASKSSGPATSVEGNTISGITFSSPRTTTGNPIFAAIDAGTLSNGIAPVTVSNNTIGSPDGGSSIAVTYNGASASSSLMPIAGIAFRVANPNGAISNNRVGSMTVSTTIANAQYAVMGIFLSNGNNSAGITVSGNQIGGATNAAALRNTISNVGTAVGIYSASPLSTISDNTIRNINGRATAGFTVAGIHLLTQNNSSISGNAIRDISNEQPAGSNLASGIYLQTTLNSLSTVTLQKNSVEAVSVSAGGTIGGLYIASTAGTLKLSNNRVHIGRRSDGSTVDNTNVLGIYSTNNNTPQLYHNTVLIDGSNSGTSNYSYAASLAGTVTVNNNILYNSRSNNGPSSIQGAYNGPAMNIDYNDLLATGSATLATMGANNYASLADLQAAGYNTHGLSIDPLFVSTGASADLHVRNALLNAGKPLSATVPTDFEGDARSATAPSMGADEITCIVPTLSAGFLDACSGVNNGSIDLSVSGLGSYAYSWSGPNGFTASTEDISNLAAGTYTVTASSGTCSSTASYTIGSVAQASIAPQPNQVLCAGAEAAAISFTPFNGVAYNWTNSNPSIGLAASGTGNIAAFTAQNSTSVLQKATIYVTPVSSNGCTLKMMVFSLSVNPVPHVAGIEDLSACAGTVINAVNFSGNIAGGTYRWYNNVPSIGLASSGSGSLPSFVAQNNSPALVSSSIVVVPVFGPCSGFPRTFLISVAPAVASISYGQSSYCQGGTVLPQRVGSAGGTWSAAPAGLSINAATGALNLAASAPGTYTVTYSIPALGGCSSSASTQVTIKPQTTVDPVPNQVYCNGLVTAPATFSGTAASFTWTNDNPSIGLAASGTGTGLPSFTTANAGPATQYAFVRVTPQGNGSSTCPGKTIGFHITVNFCAPVTRMSIGGDDAALLRSALTLGPNPASTSIRLQYSGTARRLSVEVRDGYGRTLLGARSFSGSSTLAVERLLPGSYYAVVSDAATGAQASVPFVKL